MDKERRRDGGREGERERKKNKKNAINMIGHLKIPLQCTCTFENYWRYWNETCFRFVESLSS